jgi:flagellin-specific chaperone FliS
MDDNFIEIFIDNMMKEMQWGEKIEPEVYQQIKVDYIGRVEDIINWDLLHALSTEKSEEISLMLDEDISAEEYYSFLAKNIENIDEIVLNALLEFKAKYIKPGIG